MKIAFTTALAATLVTASSFAFAGDNGGTGMNKGASTKHMNQSTDMATDPATTGSIKCDNSNANINSGCDKPGHLKQEDRMNQDQQ